MTTVSCASTPVGAHNSTPDTLTISLSSHQKDDREGEDQISTTEKQSQDLARGRVIVSETEEGSETRRERQHEEEDNGGDRVHIMQEEAENSSVTNPPSSITMGSAFTHGGSTIDSPEALNFLETWVRDIMFKRVKIINCDEMLAFYGPIKKLFQKSYPKLCETQGQWSFYKYNINKKCNEKRNNVINNLKNKFMSKFQAWGEKVCVPYVKTICHVI
jgi:hypothetical protein